MAAPAREEDEERARLGRCSKKKMISRLPFVPRQPEAGVISVWTEQADELDGAFNAIIHRYGKDLEVRVINQGSPNFRIPEDVGASEKDTGWQDAFRENFLRWWQ